MRSRSRPLAARIAWLWVLVTIGMLAGCQRHDARPIPGYYEGPMRGKNLLPRPQAKPGPSIAATRQSDPRRQ